MNQGDCLSILFFSVAWLQAKTTFHGLSAKALLWAIEDFTHSWRERFFGQPNSYERAASA